MAVDGALRGPLHRRGTAAVGETARDAASHRADAAPSLSRERPDNLERIAESM